MIKKPLLRRWGVMPPEAFDNSYGGLIQRKQRKYRTSKKAFGIERFGEDIPGWVPIVAIIIIAFIIMAVVIKKSD